MKLHIISNYDQLLYQLLFRALHFNPQIYFSPAGRPSIGYNFDLQINEILLYVLEALGFDIHGAKLNGETLVAEYFYIGELQKTFTESRYINAESLNNAINNVLQQRCSDSRYPSYADIHRITNFTLNETKANGIALSLIQLFEKRVDDWLTVFDFEILKSNGYLLKRTTRERAALVSLAAQGELWLNRKNLPTNIALAKALSHNNRAESWYLIRYDLLSGVCNYDSVQGKSLIKQRYYESELFGLYDAGITEKNISREHCKSIYDMFNRHKNAVMNHERRNRPLIAEANREITFDKSFRIRTLEENFRLAYNYVRSENYLSKLTNKQVTNNSPADNKIKSLGLQDAEPDSGTYSTSSF